MNGIIFELEEKSKYTGRYMDEEISYNDTSIDYMEEIQECDRNREIKDLLNDPCLGKIFDKGEIDDFVNKVDRSQLPEDIRFELK